MMKTCDTNHIDFLWIASVLFSRECQKEIGCQVYYYPNMKFIYNECGFISYRIEDKICLFDYDYILAPFRGHGEYKRMFQQREILCGGKLCRIETRNTILKVFLIKQDYEIIKTKGTWTFFQKHL